MIENPVPQSCGGVTTAIAPTTVPTIQMPIKRISYKDAVLPHLNDNMLSSSSRVLAFQAVRDRLQFEELARENRVRTGDFFSRDHG